MTVPAGAQDAVTSVSADLMEPPARALKAVIHGIALLAVAVVAWSCVTPVLEISAGSGTVVPEAHVQVVQSLEGGAVEAILARSGGRVVKGDVIVRLDPTAPGASRDEVRQQLAGLEAAAARLQGMLLGLPPEFPRALAESHPALVAQSLAQYQSGLAELDSAMAAFDSQIAQRRIELAETRARLATSVSALRLAAVELAALKKLRRARAAGRAEVANSESRHNELKGAEQQLRLSLPRIEASIGELQSRRAERRNGVMSRAADTLAETEVKLAALKTSLGAQQKRLDQTEIRAPASGILKIVKATGVGQVIKAGDVVAEIVPEEQSFLVEVRVRPEDIAFLEPGMPAIVKLSAYDYSIFGALAGTLERIAADSTADERGQVYYTVVVRAAQNHIERRGERWPVKSGMVANVEIVTGKRTVFQYITKPIHRMATMALRER